MHWRKDEMAQLVDLMAAAEVSPEKPAMATPPRGQRNESWWVPLEAPLGPITHMVPREVVVLVERTVEQDLLHVRLLEPRLMGVHAAAPEGEGSTAAGSAPFSAASPRNRLQAALAAAAAYPEEGEDTMLEA